MYYILSFILLFFNHLPTENPQKGRLSVSVTNLDNDKGSVFVALFNSADGFPSEGKKALKTARVAIVNKTATIVFDDLPYGYYATTTYHDENGNNKIETIFGIPKEGVGASNMKSILFGAPKFDRSKFNHQAKETKINLTIIYDIFKMI
jgi:uncharacterized protein (DUF2141 family)